MDGLFPVQGMSNWVNVLLFQCLPLAAISDTQSSEYHYSYGEFYPVALSSQYTSFGCDLLLMKYNSTVLIDTVYCAKYYTI